MIRQIFNSRRRQILIDINTQQDFFHEGGSACIQNHLRVMLQVRRMIAWSRKNSVPIISTCEVYPYRGGERTQYCVDGTEGQKKISYSLMSNRICYAADGSFDFPSNVLRHYRQVILNKRTSDPFDEPRIERLLTELHPSEFLVMGATAEGAVKSTVLGLLQRGKKVSVITDAVGYLDYHEAEMAIRKIHAKGAGLLESREIAGESHLKKGKECECEICQNCDKILSPAKI